MTGHRLQVDRRTDPYPLTWEPFALAAAALVLVLIVGAQVARTLVVVVAGGGWVWPVHDQVATSSWALLTSGDPTAGLARPVGNPPPTWLLRGITLLVEAGFLAGHAAAIGRWLDRRGPGRLRGMATPAQSEQLLGLSRLRRDAPVIRPDLHPHPTHPDRPWDHLQLRRRRHPPARAQSGAFTRDRPGTKGSGGPL